MRAPLIVAGPGIEAGGSDALAYLYDIFPTVVDLVDGTVPTDLDGKSLAPIIRGKETSVRDSVFLAYSNVQRAVRQNDWKLIRYPQVDVTQLFNVRTDPLELNDLSGDPDHLARQDTLLAELADLQKQFHDPVPLTVAKPGEASVGLAFFPQAVARADRGKRQRPERKKFPGAAKRLLFLGDSITHAGDYIALIESALRDEYGIRNRRPGEPVQLINLGLPSETCSGLSEPRHPFPRPNVHERLDRALREVNPGLVVACYGMNDGIYYPFSDERFRAFKAGINQLIEKVKESGAKLILMTPPPFDAAPLAAKGALRPAGASEYSWLAVYENYDKEVLARYADWLLNQKARVETVIDLRTPILKHVALRRKTRPGFSLSEDGVHLNQEGHRVLATAIVRAWGHGEMYQPDADHLALVKEKSQLLHDSWLSHVGHQRPGMKAGLPLKEALLKAEALDKRIDELLQRER